MQFFCFGLNFSKREIFALDIGKAFTHTETYVLSSKKGDEYKVRRYYDFDNLITKKRGYLCQELVLDSDFDVTDEVYFLNRGDK